jgi:hyperosmotically inducible periplasmic protein
LKRLLAFLVLLAIGAVALYYWRYRPATAERAAQGAAAEARQALDTVGQKLKETRYTGAVKAAFELNRELAPLSINIDSTEDGVVTLKGQVPSEDLKALAGRVAAAVPGVMQLNNTLAVNPSTVQVPTSTGVATAAPPPATGGDRAHRVEQALRANPSLAGYSIGVRDEGGRVVLSGRVKTTAEKDLAGLLARDAAGGEVENSLFVGP